jgi:hypothetical protein
MLLVDMVQSVQTAHKGTTTTNLNFFYENEEPRPFDGCKIEIYM